MSYLFRTSLLAAFCASLFTACGDKEGADSTLPSVAFATSSISFNVTAPDDSTPQARTLSGVFNVDPVYLGVITEGTAVERVTYSLSGKVATISVYPKPPSQLGPGIHSSRISVFGQVCADTNCAQLASGSAYYIDVTYSVPQVIRAISPYVAQEQFPGSVTIRGLGFEKLAVTGVLFGGFPASAFSVINDMQIEATYPPLATGRYGVTLQVDGSTVPVKSDAELVVVAWPAFVASSLPYPALSTTVIKILFDAERSALLAVTNQNGGELLRFQHAGDSWSAADIVAINTLHDVALSADGRSLLAVTDNSVVSVDANTLVVDSAWDPPLTTGTTLTSIAVTNDGDAILTSTAGANTSSPLYVLSLRTGQFTTQISLNNALATASGTGSLTVITQQDASGATSPTMYELATSTGSISATSLNVNRNTIAPAIDRYASRLALNGSAVYGSSYQLIGTLPDTTLAVAFSPDGYRLYTYDYGAAAVLVYDAATAVASGLTLNSIDTLTDITGDPGSNPQIAVSAAGDAVFLAGLDNITAIPVSRQ